MVGHEAIGVELERIPRGGVEEPSPDKLRGGRLSQEGMAQVATDGHEMGAEATVVRSGEAGLFTMKRHKITRLYYHISYYY